MSINLDKADKNQKLGTLITTILASGIVFLDGSVIFVAGPAMEKDLKLGLSGLQWVVNGYTLTLASFIILGGSLGDIYGRKKIMVWGLLGFGLASAAAGLSPGPELLVCARIVQGAAGAFVVPGSLSIITAVFTGEEERGQAIGTWAGWAGITSLLGPVLGGFLVDNFSWRWVFFINLPVIAAAVLLMLHFVPETRQPGPPEPLDWIGAGLTVIGLGGITYALIEGPVSGWDNFGVIAALVLSLPATVLFFFVEARKSNPMLPLGLFRSRNFSGANIATLAIYAALSGSFFFIGLYVQNIMYNSALITGLVLMPASIMMLLFSPRIGKLAGKYGSRFFMTFGPFIYGSGLLVLLFLQPNSNLWLLVLPAVILIGAGLCITVAPLTSTVMSSVPSKNSGSASAVNNVVSRVGGLLAISGLGIVVSSAYNDALSQNSTSLPPNLKGILSETAKNPTEIRTFHNIPVEVVTVITSAYTSAFHWVIICCAVLTFFGGLISFLLIRRNPHLSQIQSPQKK